MSQGIPHVLPPPPPCPTLPTACLFTTDETALIDLTLVIKYRNSADEEEEAEPKFAAQGVLGSGAGLNRTSWSPDARFLACGLFLGGGKGRRVVYFLFCSVMGLLLFPPMHASMHTHTQAERERAHLVRTCTTPLLNRLSLSVFHPLPFDLLSGDSGGKVYLVPIGLDALDSKSGNQRAESLQALVGE
jgi:hypothetical protein